MGIEVRNVTKTFGSFTALKDVTFSVGASELVALLGPSGSGTTTLLRIIAGLEAADSGAVLLDGADATNSNARDRGVGFVFQHYALFRHMTVADNIAFGLRVRPRTRRPTNTAIEGKVQELLRLVQLEYLGGRYPGQLSGGQRQRVALARALAVEPKTLLLDEPFGALDAKVRQELRQWLRRLHDEIAVTSVFVTHDQEEALELADRVVIMNEGRIEQEGTPEELFEHPRTPFVMHFLGDVNIFHGRVEKGRAIFSGLETEYPAHPHEKPRAAQGFARPHELDIDRTPREERSLPATVRHVNTAGTSVKVELVLKDQRTVVQAYLSHARHNELELEPGESVYVVPRQLRIFLVDD